MSNKEDIESERPARRRTTSDCKPLIEAATKELFRDNAFRITGLPVDATAREIGKHADKLKMMEELGHGASAHTAAFALKPPPTIDQIRDAIQKLKDPEMRLVDEFFWFWPEEFGKSASDPAIQALVAGDGETAMKIWASKETNPTDGVVAMHNVAVVWHLTALEWENYTSRGELDKDRQEKIEKYWRSAFKRWERLSVDDLLWEKVNARIRQIDDARLTTGFVRRMRSSLPYALDKINAGLALRYAEANQMDLARVHIQFIRDNKQSLDNFEKVSELVLAPATTRVREQIQRVKQAAEQNPGTAGQAARNLIELTLPLVEIFDLFFGEAEHTAKELLDESATTCVNCLVTYQKKTGDNQTFVELLEKTLTLAEADELRQRILENIQIGKDNLTFARLEPVFALLKTIQDSKETPRLKFQRFQRDAAPAIMKATKISGVSASFGPLGGDSETSSKLLDSAAFVLRDISLDAWNNHQDSSTAVEANRLAITFAVSEELKEKLKEDKNNLQKLNTHQLDGSPWQNKRAAQRSSPNNVGVGILVFVAILVVLGIIGSCNSTNSSSSNSSYTPSAPAYTPPPVSASGNSDGNVYQVPNSVSSTLDNEKAEIESERTALETLDAQVAALGREIENDRLTLDKTSQSAVDDFNAKVDRYNLLAQQDKDENAAFNEKVDNYNAKLRQYSK